MVIVRPRMLAASLAALESAWTWFVVLLGSSPGLHSVLPPQHVAPFLADQLPIPIPLLPMMLPVLIVVGAAYGLKTSRDNWFLAILSAGVAIGLAILLVGGGSSSLLYLVYLGVFFAVGAVVASIYNGLVIARGRNQM